MKNYRIYILAGLVLLLFSFKQPSKTVREYNISIAGVNVGNLVATREIEYDFTTYTLNSDVSVYFFKRYRIKEDLIAVYRDNILQYATVKTSVGKSNYFSAIIWSKDHYEVDINAYKYQKHGIETQQIGYSVAKIYFEKPPASAKIFSEDYGVFSDVNYTEPDLCQLVFLGKKDQFSYPDGEMVKAEMESSIKDFEISSKF